MCQVILQYYNFLRLGFDGYRCIIQNCRDVAAHLSTEISKIENFELVSDGGSGIPAFCCTLKEPTNFTLFDVSEKLRHNGWFAPAYTLPKNLTDVTVMRIVVKIGFTEQLADMLISDIKNIVNSLK